jgi:hypothetical protein
MMNTPSSTSQIWTEPVPNMTNKDVLTDDEVVKIEGDITVNTPVTSDINTTRDVEPDSTEDEPNVEVEDISCEEFYNITTEEDTTVETVEITEPVTTDINTTRDVERDSSEDGPNVEVEDISPEESYNIPTKEDTTVETVETNEPVDTDIMTTRDVEPDSTEDESNVEVEDISPEESYNITTEGDTTVETVETNEPVSIDVITTRDVEPVSSPTNDPVEHRCDFFSAFHSYCVGGTGSVTMDEWVSRIQKDKEFALTWTTDDRIRHRDQLLSALPDMSLVLGCGRQNFSPESSPHEVYDAYMYLLNFFLQQHVFSRLMMTPSLLTMAPSLPLTPFTTNTILPLTTPTYTSSWTPSPAFANITNPVFPYSHLFVAPTTMTPTFPVLPLLMTPMSVPIPTSHFPTLGPPVPFPDGVNFTPTSTLSSVNSFSTGTSLIPIAPSNRSEAVVEWSAPRRCAALNGRVPDEHRIPEGRIHRCPHCQALLFAEELTNGEFGRFSRCCANDNFRLPTLPSPPEQLLQIFRQPTYRAMSRKVNHALAFACWKCNEDKSLLGRYHAISCIRVQGCAYVLVGAVEPAEPDGRSNYIQVFFNSNNEEEAILRTCQNSHVDPTRKNIEWVTSLHRWIRHNNPIYHAYQQVNDFIPGHEDEDVKLIFTTHVPVNVDGDPRTFSDPNEASGPVSISNELGVIIDTSHSGHGEYKHDIVIKKRGNGLSCIRSRHRMKEPMLYPLLFPYGTQGYGDSVYLRQRASTDRRGRTYYKAITGHQYLKHRLYRRDDSHDLHLRHGRLTQEWILSSYLQVEENNLNFLRYNQDKLKAGKYKEVQRAMEANRLGIAGRHIILPSTYRGSPRDNVQRYCDAMAVVRDLGKPSYFITMTCNPKWREIVESLPNGLKAYECPDLVARVFNIKLNELLRDLTIKHVMGRVKGYTYVIEFQKRGLPHAHILLIMEDKDTPKCAEQYDCGVTAEFSDNPEVRKLQARHMYHRCDKRCQTDTGRGGYDSCNANYPRKFSKYTVDGTDSYPEYRRRSPEDGGHTVVLNGGTDREEILDNRRVVPHNVYLLMKYRCHINVEVCNSITAVKYLYKYVYKGHDRVMYGVKGNEQLDMNPNQIRVRGPARDEIKEFVEARYCSTSEACWRTFEFPMGKLYPRVERLPIHKEDENNVLFTANEEHTRAVLESSHVTKLSAFFTLCLSEDLMYHGQPVPPHLKLKRFNNQPTARELLYRDVAKWYTWQARNKEEQTDAYWKRRSRGFDKTVGRCRHISPTMENKELFHLRLLLNTKRGPKSFEDLRTVNGVTYPTYHEAAFNMGLVGDDKEWDITMEESSVTVMACQLRSLFVIILTHCLPMNPSVLWEKYKKHMSDDFRYKRTRANPSVNEDFTDDDYNEALLDIESQLQAFPKSRTTDYNLPATRARVVPINSDVVCSEIRNALNFDRDVEERKKETLLSTFNEEQSEAFDTINQSVINGEGKCFFVDGAGGCGKTTVATALLHATRSRGDIAIACASSGIAATLLPKGQTAHSAFKIPVEGLDADSTCNVGGLSGRAKLLRQVKFIVWDEAFMIHRYGFEAVSRTMQHLRNNNTLILGGCTLLILGDLRQTLPVLPRASRVQIIDSCLTRSKLWKHFERITLTKNMRVLSIESVQDRAKLKNFCDFLIAIGDGALPTDGTGAIQIPNQFLLPPNDPYRLLEWVYGDRPIPVPVGGSCSSDRYNSVLNMNINYYRDKAVLCPKNVDVDKLNEDMMKTLPGTEQTYLSADAVVIGEVGSDQGLHVTTEFLNSINISGLPPHLLTIKVGAVVMLLRNLNPKQGLCNGTRLIITSMTQRVLRGVILTGDHHKKKCIIPRVTLYPSNNPYPFKFGRRQFPIRHAYVMTINKSQGQTFNRTGLLLPESCFAHGQLYVAFSRCGYPPNDTTKTGMKVVVYDTQIQGRRKDCGGIRTNETDGITTQNIVLNEIFKY